MEYDGFLVELFVSLSHCRAQERAES